MTMFNTSPTKKWTLPAGTTNRHQWHKGALRAIKNITGTFNMLRQIDGQHGGESRESLVSVFGGDMKNPKAVDVYNNLGDQFNWSITRDNAADIEAAAREALPKCMETVPTEDNRTTPEQDAERAELRAKADAERSEAAAKKSAIVEKLAADLRKQYPNALGSDCGKSSHARAAANFKRILQDMGLRASVKSDSYSMGNSVTANILTPDLTPDQRKEIDAIAENFNYGTFDAYTDSSGYDHSDMGEAWELVLGRSKYCRAEYTQSDANKAAILEFLGGTEEHISEAYQIWTGADCRADEFWTKWAEDNKPTAPTIHGQCTALFSIEEHTHTKHGFQMFLVIPSQRLERDEFNRIRQAAKACGGWYSRKWGKTPGGFAFKSLVDAEGFAREQFTPNNPPPTPGKPPRVVIKDSNTAAKFRTLADNMQSQIDAKRGDRLTNTPKRQRQAMEARIDGDHLERAQQALRALADLHESGNVPDVLQGVTSKKAVFDLLRTKTNSTGYYHIGDTGEPSNTTPEARALWALISGKTDEQKAADDLKDKIMSLQFASIPGYFPTPDLVIDLMLDHAQIEINHTILEPSAGSGAILDRLPEDCTTVVHEVNHTLCEILAAKGYDARPGDFLKTNGAFKFDRVLMNPPFENQQDIDHVLHAYSKLKPGGRLVAVMSAGTQYNSNKKAQAFREFIENRGAELTALPPESFKPSGTSVNAALLVIDHD